jgi:hypothetical protein
VQQWIELLAMIAEYMAEDGGQPEQQPEGPGDKLPTRQNKRKKRHDDDMEDNGESAKKRARETSDDKAAPKKRKKSALRPRSFVSYKPSATFKCGKCMPVLGKRERKGRRASGARTVDCPVYPSVSIRNNNR